MHQAVYVKEHISFKKEDITNLERFSQYYFKIAFHSKLYSNI